MPRPLTAIALAGLLASIAIAVGGCGSSGSTTESSTSGSSGQQSTVGPTTGSSLQSPTTGSPSQGGGQTQGGSGEGGSGASGGSATSGSGSSGYKPDRSLQTFGSEVGGAEKSKVAHDLLSFFRALANQNYAKVCAGITAKNREALQVFLKAKHEQGKSCAAFLPTILHPDPETSRAAHSTITHVRVKGKDAIVFFRPPGGKVKYIAMTREASGWKSLTLAPGTPLNPLGP